MKPVGLRDSSTVAFTIILHVIFIKLSFHMDRMHTAGVAVILLTLLLNYLLIAIWSAIGVSLDAELIGLGSTSVFNLSAFTLLLSLCLLILFLEYLAAYIKLCPRICNCSSA